MPRAAATRVRRWSPPADRGSQFHHRPTCQAEAFENRRRRRRLRGAEGSISTCGRSGQRPGEQNPELQSPGRSPRQPAGITYAEWRLHHGLGLDLVDERDVPNLRLRFPGRSASREPRDLASNPPVGVARKFQPARAFRGWSPGLASVPGSLRSRLIKASDAASQSRSTASAANGAQRVERHGDPLGVGFPGVGFDQHAEPVAGCPIALAEARRSLGHRESTLGIVVPDKLR